MYENYYAVIMAGGGGTRLWPLSRQARPKQMLRLIGERSLFQLAVQRLDGVFPPERILVVTVADQAPELQKQCPQIPVENFLLEPLPRGTASVAGLACIALEHRDPNAVMAILTSDHVISNEPAFRGILRAAYQVASDGYFVTLGIEPAFAATGYGYIQRGALLGDAEGFPIFQVKRFKEKPDPEQARHMLAMGAHDWNSGMFVWQVQRVLGEIASQMPRLANQLQALDQAWETSRRDTVLAALWPGLESQTIDYGIMEGADKIAVIPASNLQWSDVGSWDALFAVLPGDDAGNIVIEGDHLGLDTQGSLVYSDSPDRLIVTLGVDNLIIVDTGDVLLVCQKEHAQQVRQVVNLLKKSAPKFT